jgi:hypothetical protein
MASEPAVKRRHTYVLELDASSEPITGVLKDAGRQRSFVGWIGLVQALEQAGSDRVARAPATEA